MSLSLLNQVKTVHYDYCYDPRELEVFDDNANKSNMVHGLLDVPVEEYTDWQRARVGNEAFRDNIIMARDVTLENCLDLAQVHEDLESNFLVKHGAKVGAAFG
ncbi:hypothetical protein N7520_007695 [Penicillium odoratum]|uniref:uncharacterized protein n=1 Tax=Penicillium odoratum TaxID=1167516 RepID=UPI0025499D99|nr:uncharacterized protein N7520_007695 [Penicillium odoratum]KAJ5760539.1 hypothetical protein N7520_007695 [Penicillium odoratum]